MVWLIPTWTWSQFWDPFEFERMQRHSVFTMAQPRRGWCSAIFTTPAVATSACPEWLAPVVVEQQASLVKKYRIKEFLCSKFGWLDIPNFALSCLCNLRPRAATSQMGDYRASSHKKDAWSGTATVQLRLIAEVRESISARCAMREELIAGAVVLILMACAFIQRSTSLVFHQVILAPGQSDWPSVMTPAT